MLATSALRPTRPLLPLLLLLVGTRRAKGCAGEEASCDAVSLLQFSANRTGRQRSRAVEGDVDVVMAYVPYNFGHTVAARANDVMGIKWGDCGTREAASDCIGDSTSAVTGCTLKYTPGKYWPEDLARSHFGNKTIFGILRDPYERMVAQFRGSYRYTDPALNATCNVSEGVKRMMREYLSNVEAGNPYVEDCQHLPQAEYFDQPYGATDAIDNRYFPQSMNVYFDAHGLGALRIESDQVEHVTGCDDKWSADLDPEARALVRQVYRRDFDLLCERFSYCDPADNTCVHGVPGMCPEQEFEWAPELSTYVRRSS